MADGANIMAAPACAIPTMVSKISTMSTVEIAELTGKRHDNVLRDAYRMLQDLGDCSSALKFEGCYKGENGKSLRLLNLPKRECLILVSGYSVELRARIIDRWQELESQAANPAIDVRNPATLTTIALQLIEVNRELEARAVAAEKIAEEAKEDQAALATIAKADGSLCMTDAAKALQQRPKDLIAYLKAHGWIYRRAGGDHWVAYQSRIQAGDLEHKVTTVLRADGTEKITEQVRITHQGLAKLAKLFPPLLSIAS